MKRSAVQKIRKFHIMSLALVSRGGHRLFSETKLGTVSILSSTRTAKIFQQACDLEMVTKHGICLCKYSPREMAAEKRETLRSAPNSKRRKKK